ncbi:MAG TPA: hypothetical protein VN946_15945 [Terriglobales bacterium]|jgi:regulator of protease activity HflC (stomatin/prohibitin superfamily)|nr:hypothetical protein [Terriglobales bacterium]
MEALYWIAFVIVPFIVLYLILGSFFTVRTAEVAVITRFSANSFESPSWD